MQKVVFKFGIFLIAFSVGAICTFLGKSRQIDWLTTVGYFALLFGAQTGMNIYMKYIFSVVEVEGNGTCGGKDQTGKCGLPAGFFVTAAQQLIAFSSFWIVLGIGRLFRFTEYFPKVLSMQEILMVLVFSLSFTMNIALNNFSLLYLSLVINLIVRSCLPIPTYLAQTVAAKMSGKEATSLNVAEMSLMLLGVGCACLAVVAEVEGSGKKSESKNLVFGVMVSIVSLAAGSSNLVLAGVLGHGSAKLNALDTVVYNAIPCAIILLPLIFFYKHESNWDDAKYPSSTDWSYVGEAFSKNPNAVFMALASGPLSLCYNTLQFGVVQALSATHVAFSGNFNKAAIIPISLLLGIEHLPPGKVYSLFNLPAGLVMLCGSFGSIGAFAAYNIVSKGKGAHGHGAAPAQKAEPEAREVQDGAVEMGRISPPASSA